MQGSSTRRAPARGSGNSGRWRFGAVLVGVLALLTLAALVVLAHGSPPTSTATSPTTQGTSTTPPDSVSVTKNPNTGNPQNSNTVPPTTFTATNTAPVYTTSQQVPPPPPPVHITSAVASVAPTQAGGYCHPSDDQQFTITGTLTTPDTYGGSVTYVWITSDGFRSPVQTVTFAPGQTSATVHDIWTLGAWYADGASRWEALEVLGPASSLTSNHASFVYTCAPVVYSTRVTGTELCDGTTWLVTAEVDVFAPAGGSITFNWSDIKVNGLPNGLLLLQNQTLQIPAGDAGVKVLGVWHVGSAAVPGDGVTVTTFTGKILVKPTAQSSSNATTQTTATTNPSTQGGSANNGTTQNGGTPSTGTVKTCTATVTPSLASAAPNTPQPVTFTGAIQLNINTPTTLTYHWKRSDGTTTTVTPDQTLALIPAIDPATSEPLDDTATVLDTWTPPTTAGQYTDTLVITGEGGFALPDDGANSLTPGMTLGTGTYTVAPTPPLTPPTNTGTLVVPPVIDPTVNPTLAPVVTPPTTGTNTASGTNPTNS